MPKTSLAQDPEHRVAARHADGKHSVWHLRAVDHHDAKGQVELAVKTETGQPPRVMFSSVSTPKKGSP